MSFAPFMVAAMRVADVDPAHLTDEMHNPNQPQRTERMRNLKQSTIAAIAGGGLLAYTVSSFTYIILHLIGAAA